jgi:hypothetical protein
VAGVGEEIQGLHTAEFIATLATQASQVSRQGGGITAEVEQQRWTVPKKGSQHGLLQPLAGRIQENGIRSLLPQGLIQEGCDIPLHKAALRPQAIPKGIGFRQLHRGPMVFDPKHCPSLTSQGERESADAAVSLNDQTLRRAERFPQQRHHLLGLLAVDLEKGVGPNLEVHITEGFQNPIPAPDGEVSLSEEAVSATGLQV